MPEKASDSTAPDRTATDPVTIKVPDHYGAFIVPNFNDEGQKIGGRDREVKGGTVIKVPEWFARETLGEEYAEHKPEKDEKALDLTATQAVEDKEGKTIAKAEPATASQPATAAERARGSGPTTTRGTGPGGSSRTTRGSED